MSKKEKPTVTPEVLEGRLSSHTARLHVSFLPKKGFVSRPPYALTSTPPTPTWGDSLNMFRVGRIYASLHKLFPERYKEEEGRSNINRDYLEDQLHEVPDIREFLSFLLGKEVGKRFPIKH